MQSLIGRLLVIAMLVTSCLVHITPAAQTPQEGPDIPRGWSVASQERAFNGATMYELVVGQANTFFVHSFERVTLRRYENGAGAVVDPEVWQTAISAHACGLFASNRAGEYTAMAAMAAAISAGASLLGRTGTT